MKLLAIDSSTEACSVAIMQGSEIIECWEIAPREHTRKLLPMVDSLLARSSLSLSQLDAIAFASGPGSFTGLRVCISVVQGLAFGADLPVVPISSLATLAQSAVDQQRVPAGAWILAALDARMEEVYWATYQQSGGLVEALGEESLSAPEAVQVTELCIGQQLIGVGPGFTYAKRVPCMRELASIEQDILPRASAAIRLAEVAYRKGDFCQADQAIPSYLRDEVAWKKTALQ